MRIQRGKVATRASRNPATEGGKLKRLRVVAQGIPMRAGVWASEGWPIHASLNPSGAGGFVDLQDFVEVA